MTRRQRNLMSNEHRATEVGRSHSPPRASKALSVSAHALLVANARWYVYSGPSTPFFSILAVRGVYLVTAGSSFKWTLSENRECLVVMNSSQLGLVIVFKPFANLQNFNRNVISCYVALVAGNLNLSVSIRRLGRQPTRRSTRHFLSTSMMIALIPTQQQFQVQ